MRLAWLKDLRLSDLPQVGGKNASLGEMSAALAAAGIRVPGGFATTADAFREFLATDGLGGRIARKLESLDCDDGNALAACGKEIRSWISAAPFPEALEREIHSFYQQLEGQTSCAARSARSCRRWSSPRRRAPGSRPARSRCPRRSGIASRSATARCSSSRATR